MKIPELLAPAGTLPIAQAAFDHGADAVYIGIGKFNLRAHSPNFQIEDVKELLSDAHRRGKKVYVALNTMPDENTLREIVEYLSIIKTQKLLIDAFIVSDPGVVLLCKEIVPEIALHLSTQTGTFNTASLRFWKQQGITRVVLPREMTLHEISIMRNAGIAEVEIFVHGAMCVSIAGRCLLGAYLNGRHPNRGDCSQPCRLRYRITSIDENKNEMGGYDAEETHDGVYLLNSKDLCTVSLIPEFVKSGIDSLKIEGRNKSIHYVASVVKVYRDAIDCYVQNPGSYYVKDEWKSMLDTVEHRPYTTGFYNGESNLQEVFTSKATSSARIIGIVKALMKGGAPIIDVKNSFTSDETLEVLPVQKNSYPQPIKIDSIFDLEGNMMDYAPSNRLVMCTTNYKLRPGDMIRKMNETVI